LNTWRLEAHPVPVIGFIVMDGTIERACTFKNYGGKLVFAGAWAREGLLTEYRPVLQYEDAGMRAWSCLLATGYYDGEKTLGLFDTYLPAHNRPTTNKSRSDDQASKCSGQKQDRFDKDSAGGCAPLIDEDNGRRSATGRGLGGGATSGLMLAESDLDALIRRIHLCWDIPASVKHAQTSKIIVRINLAKDGSLLSNPVVTNENQDQNFKITAESAVRAIRNCAPYSFMPATSYDAWKELELAFDPQ
jgi:hypothetical protein